MESGYIDFAFVKDHADIAAVLAHYGVTVPPTAKNNLRVSCIFHEEEHPSLSINLQRKVFYCFGCGAKGDLLELVCRMEACDLRSAARLVAKLSHIACAPELVAPPRRARKAARALKRPQSAARAAETRKVPSDGQTPVSEPPVAPETPEPQGGDADAPEAINPPLRFALKLDGDHPYLRERSLAPETIGTFGLGFVSRGLLKGRIAIPIHNERGELIAYAGRWPGDDGWPEGEDKYKLPEGFQKRRVLFNLHRLLDGDGTLAKGHLVLVEGYFAAMHLFTVGFPAAALMGSSIAEEQIALMKAVGVTRVSLMLDGDPPGRQAAAVIVPLLAASFFVRDVVITDGQQPDFLDEAALHALLS